MAAAITFSDYFSPITQAAHHALPQGRPSKNIYDHIGGHFFTLNGAWDSARIVETVANCFCKCIPLTAAQKIFFERISGLMNKCGNVLSIPRIIADLHFLKNSVDCIHQVNRLPADQLERSKVVGQAKKGAFINTMNLVNDVAQAGLFLNDVSIIQLGKCLPVVQLCYDGSSILNDTIELVDESFKLHHYNGTAVETEEERVVLNEKRTLSWLKIVKDLPSIIGSILSIAAVFFTSFQVPVVAAISFGLSVAWLVMKLVGTIYEKDIQERQIQRSAFV